MSDLICPCDEVVHPRPIHNVAGRASIDYRIGDFSAFRQALLRARPGEQALRAWQPSAREDLAVQLLEWWAYVADVLALYNERALTATLLRTAEHDDELRRIIRLLGYRPRPGIGATGLVAALIESPRPFVLPRGFAIEGTAADARSQVFELDEDRELGVLGRPLPASAHFPVSPFGGAVGWTGYAQRDERGQLRNDVPAYPPADESIDVVAGRPAKVAIEGVVTKCAPGDMVLIIGRDWNGDIIDQSPAGYALATVAEMQPFWNEQGLPITVLGLHPGHSLPHDARRSDYRILKATKLAHLWLYHHRYPGPKSPTPLGMISQVASAIFDPAGLFSGGVSTEPPQDPHVLTSTMMESPLEGAAHLEAITRGISPGDPILFEQRPKIDAMSQLILNMIDGVLPVSEGIAKLNLTTFLAKVTGYAESIWYANPPELDRIGQGPPIGPPSGGLLTGGPSPLPIPHSKVTFSDPLLRASAMSLEDLAIDTIVVHYGWQEVGTMLEVPSAEPTRQVHVPAPPEVPPATPLPVIVEDVTGAGVPGWLGWTTTPETETPPLAGPLRALLNLLPVSRGQTVQREVLGSGDAILIDQEFMLRNAPLTYLADTGPHSHDGYRSTLRIRVGGIEWREVSSFYGQPPDARVFVTREDDQHRTFVRFGDGELGARLPTGVDNVVATYRFGSGADVPPIGALTTIVRPQPGLQAIRNPIAPAGGADPDPPAQIRQYAPRSVLAFGRAISGDDYATIAAQTPGVRRTKITWGWDAAAQRSLVKIHVGDDQAAVDATREALRAFSDPNRPILVALASPIYLQVGFTAIVDPAYEPAAVKAAVMTALLDPSRPPLGNGVSRIDEVLYHSEIYDACVRVPGVIAIHHLAIHTAVGDVLQARPRPPTPGFGRRYEVFSEDDPLVAAPEVIWTRAPGERHRPGEGRFYLLQDAHLHVATEVWRHGG